MGFEVGSQLLHLLPKPPIIEAKTPNLLIFNAMGAELRLVRDFAEKNGAFKAVVCDHWARGGEGALALADAVVAACDSPSSFRYLYPLERSIQDKIRTIASLLTN